MVCKNEKIGAKYSLTLLNKPLKTPKMVPAIKAKKKLKATRDKVAPIAI